MTRFVITWLFLCLSACGGCFSHRATPAPVPTIVRTVTVPVRIPSGFLLPCAAPPADSLRVTGDLVRALIAWRAAALSCAAQVDALRAWAADTTMNR